jgi:subtilisin-like proprotein convertase family protein
VRKLGFGNFGRVGVVALAIASAIAGCGDNGVTPPPDAPDIDAPPPKPAVLSMMPSQNDFGSVIIGSTSGTASFTVTNTGEATSGAITPVVTGTNAGDFLPTNGCTTLAGGGTCVITVVFKPSTPAGTKSASLVVSGSPGGTVMAALLGTANVTGTIMLNAPTQLSFGSVTVGSLGTQQTFTFQNSGTVATSVITTTAAGSDPGEFTKVSDNCNGQTLAAAATCTVVVNFRPTSPGPKTASFIVSAATGGSANGSVSGTGVAPANLTLNPGFQDYGTVAIGSSSSNVTFTVQNIGGVASSAIANTGTGDYTIVNSTCAGVMLAPLATCSIAVRFTPTVIGTRPGTLDVVAAQGGTRSSALTGVGVQIGFVQFAVTDSPFAFPGTTVGQTSTSHLFTITNTGGTATGALGTALGGTDPSQFTIVGGSNGCQGTVLAPNGTCTIAAVFSPTSGGNKTATLTVTGTPGGSAVAIISGLGIAPAQFDFDIDSRDYGSVVTGTMGSIQRFRLTNIGGQNSAIPAAALNGANASEFTITSNTCSAALTPSPAAGSFCDIFVQFLPVSVGAKLATLDVLGNPGGPVSAGLSGNGVAQAALSVTPSILTFPLTLVGNSAVVQSFTVTNQGSVTTGVLAVTVVGAAAADYSQTNNCEDGGGPGTDVLIAGASCTVDVTFSPTARGARNASIQITGNPGGTVTTALNGTSLPRLEILTPTPVTIPNTHDFGSSIVDPNPTLIATTLVTVVNNTNASQTITNVESDTTLSFFPTAGCTGAVVGAGATCTFNVGFAPHQVGPVAGSYLLTITGGNATGCPVALPNCNTATQQVNGIGTNNTISISDGDVTPTSHNFGNQGTGTSSQIRTFTVTNNGTSNTGTLAVDLAGTGFQITSNTCSGAVLTSFGPGPLPAAGSQCTIGAVFTPAVNGAATGTITVRTSLTAPSTLGGTVMAMLSGTGIAPAPLANPVSLDFGTLFAGEAVVRATPTVNTATNKVIVVTNPNDVDTRVDVTVNNGSSQYSRPAGITNDCPIFPGLLGPGLTCNVEIQFIPTLPIGVRAPANVLIQLGVGNLSATVPLMAAVKSTISYVAAPTAFTNVVVGASATQTLTVHNDTTNQTLNGFVVTAGGGVYNIFNNTCNVGTLAPGAMCTFDLTYTPTSAGSNPTNVVVTANRSSDNLPTGFVTAPVTATAISPANITVSPGAFAYGSEITGQNGSSQVFTFTNIGGQTSGTFSATLTGAQAANWSITATTCGTALIGGGTCTATVRFNPTAAGALTASIGGTAAPGGSPSAVVTGTGVALNGLRVTPTAFTFADTTAGQNSASTSFTVQNTNGTTAAPLNISVSNTTDFSLVAGGTCPVGAGNLAAGASCTQLVRFNPASSVAPAKTSTLNIDGTTFANLYGGALTIANVTSNIGGSFSNNTGIIIPSVGNATPASSDIIVSGVAGNVSSLRVRLKNVSHTFLSDVDVLLVSPDGRRFILMSDVGGASSVTNRTYTIDDAATQAFTAASPATGTYRPTNINDGLGGDVWTGGGGASPAPTGTATLTSTFAGAPANGTWSLLVVDDANGDQGSIGGWDLEVNNTGFPDTAIGNAAGARTFVLTNNGQTTAGAITGVIGGADFSHYLIVDSCNGVSLAPGASCNLVVDFRPTTTGLKTATVTYSGGFSQVVTFTGLAVNPALLTITPSVLQNDGSRPIGELDTLATTFTIGNSPGTAITSGIAFSLSNSANYTFAPGGSCVLDGSQTLLPGANCTVNVFFSPTQLGVQATNLVVTAITGGTVNGLMTGTGTQALVLTGQTPAFVAAQAGNLGSTQTLTFKNEADSSTTLIQTVLTGSTDFSILSDNCGGSSLGPNQSCTIDVHFTPSGLAASTRMGVVTISGVVTGTATTASANLTATVLVTP